MLVERWLLTHRWRNQCLKHGDSPILGWQRAGKTAEQTEKLMAEALSQEQGPILRAGPSGLLLLVLPPNFSQQTGARARGVPS
jgi:hypothetical protein